MSQEFIIDNILPYHYNKFFFVNEFTDISIHTNKEVIPAHKIFLAYNCKYFHKLFADSAESISDYTIPFNPLSEFKTFISALYSGQLRVTRKSLIPLISISEYYSCEYMIKILKFYFSKIFPDGPTVDCIKQFCKCGCLKFSLEYIDQIILLISQSSESQKQKIFKHIYIEHLLEIVKSKYYKSLLSNERFLLISRVCQKYTNISQEDKEKLSSTLDFNFDDIQSYVLNYNINWIPFSVSKKIFSNILDYRRKTMSKFFESFQKQDFYNFSYNFLVSLYSIQEFNHNEQGVCDIVQSVCKATNMKDKAFDFEVFSLDASPSNIPELSPAKIFSNDKYYCSSDEIEGNPYFNISFNKIRAKCHSIAIQSIVNNHGTMMKAPESLFIALNGKPDLIEVPASHPGIYNYKPDTPFLLNHLHIERHPKSKYNNILRISKVSVFGELC